MATVCQWRRTQGSDRRLHPSRRSSGSLRDSTAAGELDTIIGTQHRFNNRQVNWLRMLVSEVFDIRSRPGLKYSTSTLTQNLTVYCPKRVVIVHKKNRAHGILRGWMSITVPEALPGFSSFSTSSRRKPRLVAARSCSRTEGTGRWVRLGLRYEEIW